MKTLFQAAALLLLWSFGSNLNAQAWRIDLGDDLIIEADSIKFDGKWMDLYRTGSPDRTIEINEVFQAYRKSEQGTWEKYYFNEHRSARRLTLSQTAFNLRKGEAFYQNTMLLGNQFGYGISDYVSVDLTVIPYFVIAPYALNVRGSVPIRENLHFSVGLTRAGVLPLMTDFDLDFSAVNFWYANLSYGTPDRFVNIGTTLNGINRSFQGAFDRQGTVDFFNVINISGGTRLTEKHILLGEIFIPARILPEDEANVLVGTVCLRVNKRNHNWDYGLYFISSFDVGVLPAPYISYNRRFKFK